MPKETRKAVSTRQVMEPISHPTKIDVVARPVDTFVQPQASAELEGLVKGLGEINPKIQSFFLHQGRKNRREAIEKGKTSALRGEELKPGSTEYFVEGYQNQRGLVEGDKYGIELMTAYETEFNKDSGDIEEWLKTKTQDEIQGIDDEHFTRGFAKNNAKFINKIREEQALYQRGKITDNVEADAQHRLSSALDAEKKQNGSYSVETIDALKKELSTNFGVGGARFNEILYNTIHEKGLKGEHEAYDILKKDRPDGTKGIYWIPKWKEVIDKAQIASRKVFLANEAAADEAEANLEDTAIDKRMVGIMETAKTNPRAARQAFDQLNFSTATSMSKYSKVLENIINAREDDGEGGGSDLELQLKRRILDPNDNVTFKELINADLDSKSLARVVTFKNAQASAQRAGESASIHSTPQAKRGAARIKAKLKPHVGALEQLVDGSIKARKIKIAEDMQQILFERIEGRKPEEISDIVEDVVKMGERRQQESEAEQRRFDAANITYRDMVELKMAIIKGYITDEAEIQMHIRFFEENPVGAIKGNAPLVDRIPN